MGVGHEDLDRAELERLMAEFPDWKERFPDIYNELNPPRYSKHGNKKDVVPVDPDRVMQKRATTVPHTDYELTYRRHKAYRPRSTKRPPPSPRDPCPPPMSFETFQRTEFKPKSLSGRAEPIKMEEQYTAPDGAVEGKSSYARDFPEYNPLPELKLVQPDWSKRSPLKNSAKFNTRTTSKDHYVKWNTSPVKPFGDLPCFTGSILYPERGHFLETTTSKTFRGAHGKPADLIQQSSGNIKIEGDHDLNTVNKMTYHSFEDARPAEKIVHQDQTVPTKTRGKFSAQTQTKKDYGGFGKRQPRPPKPIEPAPDTINLKFNNKQSFDTEQRRQFPGIDTRDHPMPKSFKKESDEYKRPDVKFDAISSQRNDFQPIDVEGVYHPPIKPISRERSGKLAKLDDMTMNKQFFKKWDTPARVRYGDFHGGHDYVPPASKFNTTTTNQDEFITKSTEMRPSFKPDDKAIVKDGNIDGTTVYAATYKSHTMAQRLDKKQAALLLKELKKRKVQNTKLLATQTRSIMVQ